MFKFLEKFTKVRDWYGKYERPISSLSLIGGFVFDALTLRRVDLFWENFWIIAHLTIIAVCMVLIHALEKNEGDEANPSRIHFWLVNILQFVFGGVLSAYLVFYFRASDIFASWPFLLILALCFWANESLKRHFVRLVFQVSLFYLSLFTFAIYLLPVLLHKIDDQVFLLSGILSLAGIIVFLGIIRLTSKDEFQKNWKMLFFAIAGIFGLFNFLYFADLIPPLPLSLKDAGVFHSLQRQTDGNYLVTEEPQKLNRYFTLYPSYHKTSGEGVYVYSAIFSPPSLNTTIIHEWQQKDGQTGKWITVNRISLPIKGGREGGFRTYSEKFNPAPGLWRVNVLTETGQTIDRIRLKIELVNEEPAVIQEIKD
jgi:hypothetical protein